jgi:hypothetical protein
MPVVIAEWNSLEIVKLAVAAITPIVVALVGWWVSKGLRAIEQAQWTNRKLVERRLDVYDRMAEPLNDLYVFFRRIGHFQQVTPLEAVKRKRVLDRTFYVNEAVMTERFVGAYKSFMDACFQTYVGEGHDARLKADLGAQRDERGARWSPSWDDCFVKRADLVTDASTINVRYRAVVDSFTDELGIKRSGETGRP